MVGNQLDFTLPLYDWSVPAPLALPLNIIGQSLPKGGNRWGGVGRFRTKVNTGTEDKPQAKRLVRRIAGAFRPYWPVVTVVGLLILITAGIGVVNPLLIRVVFDSALFPTSGGPDLNLLWILAGVMAGITVLGGLLGIWHTYLTNQVGQRVMGDLRERLYRHLQSQPLSFFTDTRTGEIQSRVANDVGGVQTVVTNTISDTIGNLVIFISTLVAMAILSWQLALISVGMVPAFAFMSRYVGQRRRRLTAEAQDSKAEMSAITQETLSVSGITLSKLFGRQDEEIRRFSLESQRLSDLSVRQQITGQSFWAVMQIFFSVSPVVIYLLAGYLISGDSPEGITAGTIVAFTTLQSRLYFPISSLLQVSVEIQSSLALFERIFGYLDIVPRITNSPLAMDLKPEETAGRVTFDSVRMSYRAEAVNGSQGTTPDGGQHWALDGISFDVKPGQLAAFVGPSGAGKTSITYLISRLYDATEGAVRIDGVNVRDIHLSSLSKLIGYVTQDSFLFHTTVRNNLLYGAPDATQAEIEDAAKAAFIHDRIMALPEGYETVVGEQGYRFSGGEETAALHRPGYPAPTQDTDTGRSDISPGHLQRAIHPGSPRTAPQRQNHDCHSPPAVHHCGRGHDIRHRPGSHCRARYA